MDMEHDRVRKGGGEGERIKGRKEGGKMGGREKGRKEGEPKIQGMNEQKERCLETVYRYLRKCNLSQRFPVNAVTLQFSYLSFKVV